jgi:hypothetical protein
MKSKYIIDNITNCWNWNQAKFKGGYGIGFKAGIKSRLAHRIFYQLKYGLIPDDIELDHLCRNRACVNPDHLEPVTKTINQRRGLKSRITLDIAKQIKILAKDGVVSQREIAKQYGVSQRLVWNILHELTWKEI